MKNKLIIISSISITLILLLSCNERTGKNVKQELYIPNLESQEGVEDYIMKKPWSEWGGKLTFNRNGECNFYKADFRTNQAEWDINGKFNIGKSKFIDNGHVYWYVKIQWEMPGIVGDFYTIYSTHLVGQSEEWLYFDKYGPVLESFRSEGGLVLDRDKVYQFN